MIEKLLESGKHDVFYRVSGNGKPVVLIHGFGEDGTIWDRLATQLKKHFQCIIPDLPGSGKSTLKNGDWSMEALAESVKAVIDNEGITSATLLGHSMGGYITLAFAEKYENNLQGFALMHSSAFADNREKIAARKRGIQFIEEHGAEKFLEQATPSLFSEEFRNRHTDIVQELINRYANFQDAALVHYYEAMMQRPDRTHVLKKYPNPVLFMFGEHDTAIPLTDGLKQCHLPRFSYIHILKNSGHMGMIEETDRCCEILVKDLQNF